MKKCNLCRYLPEEQDRRDNGRKFCHMKEQYIDEIKKCDCYLHKWTRLCGDCQHFDDEHWGCAYNGFTNPLDYACGDFL